MALRINTGEYLRELSPPPSPTGFEGRSRRVKFLSVWARTRFFQKLLDALFHRHGDRFLSVCRA